MDWLRNIGWLVLSVMWLNFYSLNQFGRNCYFKITDLNLSNNGINAVNLSNILNHKEIISHVPEFFSESTVPIVYYTYIDTIAPKILNYKKSFQNFNVEKFLQNIIKCNCSLSPVNNDPLWHVVTGDLNVVNHNNLWKIISNGSKFRETQTINWGNNFKIMMDPIEEYTRTCVMREEVELDTLSEWTKAILWYSVEFTSWDCVWVLGQNQYLRIKS